MVRVSVALFLLVLLMGCATYDRPSFVKSPVVEVGDLMPYKQLTRHDFRASRPAGSITEASLAAICTQIAAEPYAQVGMAPVETADGVQKYEAIFERPVFYAVANRACSWWNVASAGMKKNEEILEHEQVHFAITELSARELNRRAMAKELPAQATAGIYRELAVQVRQEFLKRDAKFDEEMAGLFASRTLLKEWLRQVESELRDTQLYARGPSNDVSQIARIP